MNTVRFSRCRLCDQLRVDLSTRMDVGLELADIDTPLDRPCRPINLAHGAEPRPLALGVCARRADVGLCGCVCLGGPRNAAGVEILRPLAANRDPYFILLTPRHWPLKLTPGVSGQAGSGLAQKSRRSTGQSLGTYYYSCIRCVSALSAHTVSAAEARSITPTTTAITGTSRITTKAVNVAITHSRIATESLTSVRDLATAPPTHKMPRLNSGRANMRFHQSSSAGNGMKSRRSEGARKNTSATAAR